MEYQTKIIILNRNVFLGLKCEKFLFSIYHENAQSNNYEMSKDLSCHVELMLLLYLLIFLWKTTLQALPHILNHVHQAYFSNYYEFITSKHISNSFEEFNN